ncbi:MAG: hypothetical protein AB7W28_00985 [Armatimonadota bacterium]
MSYTCTFPRSLTRGSACAVAVLAALGLALTQLAVADDDLARPQALASAGPSAPENIGAYPRHENHPTKKWVARLRSEPMSYELQHWACYHESHAPQAVALEGQIGMTVPSGANWYSNGFFNFALDDQEGRNFAVKAVRAIDSGERASCEFLWELPQAWVRVRFLVVPGRFPLFCAITQYPKGEQVPVLRLRLACYPGGYFRDGLRVARTPVRVVRVGERPELDPVKESSVMLYDEKYDLGVEGSEGGCGALVVADGVGRSSLDIGSYGCFWNLEAKPGIKELRLAFWDGLRMKNADLVPCLEAEFAAAAPYLVALDFNPLMFRESSVAGTLGELEKLIAETQDSAAEAEALRGLQARLAELRPRVTGATVDLEAEDEYLQALQQLDKLLWQLRMKWVFAD